MCITVFVCLLSFKISFSCYLSVFSFLYMSFIYDYVLCVSAMTNIL